VVGSSDLAGDFYFHAFLWDDGVLTDLGAATQFWSNALWINDNGAAVGWTNTGQNTSHATLWDHGTAIDLGTVGGDLCSIATSINESRQVVGYSGPPCNQSRGFLWEDGGPMVDLNSLVQPPSNIVVTNPVQIDDRGEIAAQGVLPDGDTHFVMLVPDGDCESDCEQRLAQSQNRAATMKTGTIGTLPQTAGKPSDWLRTLNRVRIPANRQAGSAN